MMESPHLLWQTHSKHILVLTAAGKPVWSRWGDDYQQSAITSLVQAIIAKSIDIGDPLQVMTVGDNVIVFMVKGPLYFLLISRTGEPLHSLKQQLRAVHATFLFFVTSQLHKRLENRPSTDVRPLIAGSDATLRSLLRFASRSPSLWLDAYPILALPSPLLRTRALSILSRVASVNSSGSAERVVYTILTAGYTVIAWAQSQSGGPGTAPPTPLHVHPSPPYTMGDSLTLRPLDLLLLLCFTQTSGVLRRGPDVWTPVCLPGLSESASVHAYISCLTPSQSLTSRQFQSAASPLISVGSTSSPQMMHTQTQPQGPSQSSELSSPASTHKHAPSATGDRPPLSPATPDTKGSGLHASSASREFHYTPGSAASPSVLSSAAASAHSSPSLTSPVTLSPSYFTPGKDISTPSGMPKTLQFSSPLALLLEDKETHFFPSSQSEVGSSRFASNSTFLSPIASQPLGLSAFSDTPDRAPLSSHIVAYPSAAPFSPDSSNTTSNTSSNPSEPLYNNGTPVSSDKSNTASNTIVNSQPQFHPQGSVANALTVHPAPYATPTAPTTTPSIGTVHPMDSPKLPPEPYHPDRDSSHPVFLITITTGSSGEHIDQLSKRTQTVTNALLESGIVRAAQASLLANSGCQNAVPGYLGGDLYAWELVSPRPSPSLALTPEALLHTINAGAFPGLLHFLYIWKPLRQWTGTAWPPGFQGQESLVKKKRVALLRAYSHMYDVLTKPTLKSIRHSIMSYSGGAFSMKNPLPESAHVHSVVPKRVACRVTSISGLQSSCAILITAWGGAELIGPTGETIPTKPVFSPIPQDAIPGSMETIMKILRKRDIIDRFLMLNGPQII